MNAREICSEVYGLSGFSIPTAFQNGSDPDDNLIFFLLRRVARDLAKYRWEELVVTSRITIIEGTTEYNLPSDFREMIPGTMRTMEDLRIVDFPSDFETWAQIDSKVGITGVQHRLRFQGGKLVTLPSDTEEYTIRFEYVSNNSVQDAEDENLTKNIFEKDGDIWLLDDDLVIKALKAKWSIEKGLETIQADMGDYANFLLSLTGTQAGSKRIMMGSKSPYFPQAPYTNLWK